MQSIIRRFKIVARAILNYFINLVFFVFFSKKKRQKDIVVCGGWTGGRFADNSKAFFLFLLDNKEKLELQKVCFVLKDKDLYQELQKAGFDVLLSKSIVSLKTHLKSLYHIVDCAGGDLDSMCSMGAVRINLWHGFPLKKIQALATRTENNKLRYSNFVRKSALGNWHDYISIATSSKQRAIQARSFMIDKKQILLGAYPRIVYMLGNIKRFYMPAEKQAVRQIEQGKEASKKIIGYFPTFRDLEASNKKCMESIERLDKFASSNNCLIVTKLHFAARNLECEKGYDSVINLPPEADLYNFLELIDILITDYSSVYFDYMVLNRPMIFYCFDYDYYATEDRGLLFDYDDFTPGNKPKDFTTLSNSILETLNDPVAYTEKFAAIRTEVMNIVFDGQPKTTEEDLFQLWEEMKQFKVSAQ